jgi:hypothetical protein
MKIEISNQIIFVLRSAAINENFQALNFIKIANKFIKETIDTHNTDILKMLSHSTVPKFTLYLRIYD